MIQNIGQQPNSFLSHHRIMAASSCGIFNGDCHFLGVFLFISLEWVDSFKHQNDVENLTLLSNVRFLTSFRRLEESTYYVSTK